MTTTSGSLARRPRLASHLLARKHLVGGEASVVLHDQRTGRAMRIGPREWALLAAADGTRDLEGIAAAAARDGAWASVPVLRAFLEQLAAAGALASGPGDPREGDPGAPVPPDRPLDVLPFALRCDGSGSCCRLYASVLFAPVEAARARGLLPLVLDGGSRHEQVFLPAQGSGPTPGSAVAQVDGRCAYLGPAGRCGLHAAGGASAKPLGCRSFPATFVDDGESVRVSAAVECACVLASALPRPPSLAGLAGEATAGEPLVPAAATVRFDLDEAVHVTSLPELVEVAAGVRAPRRALSDWSRAVVAAPSCADGVAGFLALAGAVDSRLDVSASLRALAAAEPPGAAELRPWLAALQARASRRAREDADWRAPGDLARRATRWIAEAASALLEPDGLALRAALASSDEAGASAASEAFYLRAVLHGHQLVAADLPLRAALRDRAGRVLVARALPRAVAREGGPEDPACAHPLALVEAMLRGHGLDACAHDLATARPSR